MCGPRHVLLSPLRNVLVHLEFLASDLARKVREVALFNFVIIRGLDQLLKVPRQSHGTDVECTVRGRYCGRGRFRRQRVWEG